MLTSRAVFHGRLFQKALQNFVAQQEAYAHHASAPYVSKDTEILGNRDRVGFGVNGSVHYQDRLDFPMPAVRFMPNTPDVLALREKEKGDWKKLSIEEKKKLYRASFRQTIAEVYAHDGTWKSVLTGLFVAGTLTLWIAYAEIKYILPELPESLKEENRALLLRKTLDLKHGIITGISAEWDYEKDDWKK